jgi:hypothetical protein
MRRLPLALIAGVLLAGVPGDALAHWARGVRPRIDNVSVNAQSTQTILWGRYSITNYRFKSVRVVCWFEFNVRFFNSLTGESRRYTKRRAWKHGPLTIPERTRFVRTRIRKTAVSHPSLSELGEGWERDFESITMPDCHVA